MKKYTGPLSMQLWSTRGADSIEYQIEYLKGCGYGDIQPFHDQYENVDFLKSCLERHQISCRSGHFHLAMFEGDAAALIDAARRLGMKLVVAPWLDPEDRPRSVEGWQALHRRLQGINETMAKAGLGFAWHNHDFEFQRLPDGSYGIEHLLGDDIDFAVDIAWIQRAGEDPAYWLRRYAGRIPAVHIKDLAPEGQNQDQLGFADVGDGIMDWHGLWQLLDELQVPLRIAEHDQPGDWRRFAARSARAMTRLRQLGPDPLVVAPGDQGRLE